MEDYQHVTTQKAAGLLPCHLWLAPLLPEGNRSPFPQSPQELKQALKGLQPHPQFWLSDDNGTLLLGTTVLFDSRDGTRLGDSELNWLIILGEKETFRICVLWKSAKALCLLDDKANYKGPCYFPGFAGIDGTRMTQKGKFSVYLVDISSELRIASKLYLSF